MDRPSKACARGSQSTMWHRYWPTQAVALGRNRILGPMAGVLAATLGSLYAARERWLG